MVAFPDIMRIYEAKLLDLEQVHGIMETIMSMASGTLDRGMTRSSNRMVLFDPLPDRVQPQEIVEWLEEEGRRSMNAWGVRTLVEPDIMEWRHISVRRLVNYIEKSVQEGTQWVVFENNDEDLWSS